MAKSINNLQLVKMALRDKTKKAKLKSELSSLVDTIVNLYMDHGYGSTRDKLREVSWTYFDFALKKYAENMENKHPGKCYKFSTYFSWYIKTSIETYLGISKEPLKGIRPRRKR